MLNLIPALLAPLLVLPFSPAGNSPQPKNSPPLARFALISDTHTTRGTRDDQPTYRVHLEEVIPQVNAARVDAVLVAGDLTNGGLPDQYADFREQVKGFHAPVLVVAGNHDVGDKHLPGQDPKAGVTEKRVEYFEEQAGPSFFEKDIAGVRIIGLDASLLGSGLPRETDEWAFLERAMDEPSTKPTIVFQHYPPFLKSPGEPSDHYWNLEPAPRARLLALLEKGHVNALLTGHLHRPLTNHLGPMLIQTTPPVAWGIPLGKQPEGWTLVTVLPNGEVQTEFHQIMH